MIVFFRSAALRLRGIASVTWHRAAIETGAACRHHAPALHRVRRLSATVVSALTFGLGAGLAGWVAAVDGSITWTLPPSPTTVTINANEVVTWNGTLSFHPLVTSDATFAPGGTVLASTGTSYSKSFPTPGTYYFVCGVHGSLMTTTVTVLPPCPQPPYALLDIDGNGTVDALTDGLLFIRYAFGLRGSALIAGAVGSCASRSSAADIETYLATHVIP